jgi:hypothetical protein
MESMEAKAPRASHFQTEFDAWTNDYNPDGTPVSNAQRWLGCARTRDVPVYEPTYDSTAASANPRMKSHIARHVICSNSVLFVGNLKDGATVSVFMKIPGTEGAVIIEFPKWDTFTEWAAMPAADRDAFSHGPAVYYIESEIYEPFPVEGIRDADEAQADEQDDIYGLLYDSDEPFVETEVQEPADADGTVDAEEDAPDADALADDIDDLIASLDSIGEDDGNGENTEDNQAV